MNVKEKFNLMTEQIEKIIKEGDYLKPREIAERIAASQVMSFRELNTIFHYLTGYLLQDYIRERQLMESYSMLISIPVFDVEMAISVTGYDNQSSFGKKFKEYFSVTPNEAFMLKDDSVLKPSVSWEDLSTVITNESFKDFSSRHKETRFGISMDVYDKMMEALEYQALFEFTDAQSDVAFKISEEMNAPLRQAFEFVDEVCHNPAEFMLNDSLFECSATQINDTINSVPALKYVYFNVHSRLDEAMELIREAKAWGYNLKEVDSECLKGYFDHNIALKSFMKAYQIYTSCHSPEVDFRTFLSNLLDGMSVEDAQIDYYVDSDFVGIEEENKRIREDYEIEETYTDEFLGIDRTGKYDDVVMDDYDDEDDEYEEDGGYYDF